MRFCGAKNWLMLQPLVGQFPTGMPSVDVSTLCAPADSDKGTFVRLKNQILHVIIQRPSPIHDDQSHSRDTRACELGDPHAAATGRERRAPANRVRVARDAALVVVRVRVAVGGVDDLARLVRARLRAARLGVEAHLRRRHVVHALERVDLAPLRPHLRRRPERGPDGALGGAGRRQRRAPRRVHGRTHLNGVWVMSATQTEPRCSGLWS
jgi:hypothetical protein